MSYAVQDMMGQELRLEGIPRRIVSLVPSQTELLYDLGLEEEVVGITKFCIHPEAWFRAKARVGGTKTVHFDRVQALQPDLIIANKEENVQDQVEALRAIAPVWVSDIRSPEDNLEMIRQIGLITGTLPKAEAIIQQLQSDFATLPLANCLGRKVAYLIWYNPVMAAGNDTFIHEVLSRIGFENVLKDTPRYPELNMEALQQLQPELLLLSSEPFPFAEKHIKIFQEHLPETTIMLVDGELFSWYGSRMLHAVTYFNELFI
ncbi:Vitamin B12-binding protein precursor [compost metagenome]